MAIALGFTLDDVKTYLGYPTGSPSDTSRDFMLQLWLNAAVDALKASTGRSLELGVYRDTWGYRSGHVYLREYPIREVLAITYGDNVVTQEVDCQVFKETGRVQFLHGGWMHRFGSYGQHNRLVIDYVGGYAVLPSVLQMAALVGIQAANTANLQSSAASSFGGSVGVIKQLTVADVGSVSYQTRTGADYTTAALQQAINEHLGDYLAAGSNAYTLGAPLLHESERIADTPGSPYP